MKKLLIFAALAVGVIAFTSATAEARPYGSYSHGHRGSSSCGKSYHHYPTYRYPSYGSSSFHFSFGSSSRSYGHYRHSPPPVYNHCPPPVYRYCPPPVYYPPCPPVRCR